MMLSISWYAIGSIARDRSAFWENSREIRLEYLSLRKNEHSEITETTVLFRDICRGAIEPKMSINRLLYQTLITDIIFRQLFFIIYRKIQYFFMT